MSLNPTEGSAALKPKSPNFFHQYPAGGRHAQCAMFCLQHNSTLLQKQRTIVSIKHFFCSYPLKCMHVSNFTAVLTVVAVSLSVELSGHSQARPSVEAKQERGC